MNGQELFPILGGLLLGLILSMFHPSIRARVGLLLTVCIGVSATLTSGEFSIHWIFLVLDTLLVAVSASFSLLGIHLMRLAFRRSAH